MKKKLSPQTSNKPRKNIPNGLYDFMKEKLEKVFVPAPME